MEALESALQTISDVIWAPPLLILLFGTHLYLTFLLRWIQRYLGKAIAAGGPGAVLWMWLTGVFGIATKYAEAVLPVEYRIVTPSGFMAGGRCTFSSVE
jgi:AGCS family alanine or glycine:cation symporter